MKKYLYLLITWSLHITGEIIGKIYLLITKNLFKDIGEKIYFVGIPFITGIEKISFGNNISFGANLTIRGEGGVEIQDNVVAAKNLTIYTCNHDYAGSLLPFDYNNIYKKVTIKKNTWIGKNVSIIPGVTIGEGVVIGMGSVVTKDIPDCAIIGGNPAKVIKYRDMEHYNNLENKALYFTVKPLLFYLKNNKK